MTLVTLPYRDSLSQGKPEKVAEILTDMDAIATVVNGQLGNDNVSPNAAIQLPKFAISGTPDKTRYLRDDATWQVPASGAQRTIEDKTLTTDKIFDFSAIPLTFKHLLIYGYFRSTRAATDQADMMIRFNDDAGANQYDSYHFMASGPTPTRDGDERFTQDAIQVPNMLGGATSGAGLFAHFTLWIPNYADTVCNKAMVLWGMTKRSPTTGQFLVHHAGGWWRSSAAITKIAFLVQGGTTATGSRAQLLGVL
jgi:hypothetical protein